MKLAPSQTILFQGDSITDAGRDRTRQDEPNDTGALGPGYAGKIASALLADYPPAALSADPSQALRLYNRGIGGHRVVDLYARWKCDAINLAPDILSILIGVNDTWHEFGFGSPNGVELDRFEVVYRMMLQFTRQRLPKTELVLCEPFVLLTGVVTPEWVADIDARREIVARLAAEFGSVLVPFQRLFNESLSEAPADYWTTDGVHPTPAGHERMARFWRKTVGV